MKLLFQLLLVGALWSSCWAGQEWIEESNGNAQLVLQLLATYKPEEASALGLSGYDEEIMDLGADLYERLQMDTLAAVKVLKKRLEQTENRNVQQDLGILIKRLEERYQTKQLEHELMLPYFNLSEVIYRGYQQLLDSRVDATRYPAALNRLKKYNGTEEETRPITELARERTREAFTRRNLTGPYVQELEQDRNNSERYLQGIRELFESSGLEGWQADFSLLEQQLKEYDQWLVAELHPRARPTHLLPEALYADNLKSFGVEMEPKELIQRAKFGFAEIREEMEAIARQLAKERGYPSTDYRDVIRLLKAQQVSGEEILQLYRQRLADIEAIIKEQGVVTLPERDVVIRLASEAEAASIPAPHLDIPQLIGNTGQPSDFVMPLNNPNSGSEEQMDDFTHQAVAWTLTAHEARPGHELQFATMLEGGVSLPRAVFAFNSANIEGWALYAEAVMKRYFPLDGQLFALQHRLLRAARAFLDPMLNLGMISPADAKQVLIEDVVLSEPMAQQEIDRYQFRAPGQATSYYYGYLLLMTLRTEVELAQKEAFDQKVYHDYLLDQGVLPLSMLRAAVLARFVIADKE